jgi:hypothetical protein
MRESLLVSFASAGIVIALGGVALADEIVEPLVLRGEEGLHGDSLREVLLHELLVIRVTQLVQDRPHV